MNKQDKLNSLAWNNYWDTGFNSTFTGHEDTGFFKELEQAWIAEFESLEDGSTIVDLGAGNGALTATILATNETHNKGFDVIAVDYAAVKNSSELFSKKRADLTVKDNTSIEETGLEGDSVDLCVSQFGFEYADHEKASSEAYRILKEGGRLIAIVHHKQSEITQSCASAHMQIGLCHRTELTKITEKLLRRLRKLSKSNRNPQQDETAEQLREELNKRADRLLQYGEDLPDQNHINYFLTELTSLFGPKAKSLSFEQKMRVIEMVEHNAKGFQLRMEAMIKASLDMEAIDNLTAIMERQGFEVIPAELVQHEFKTYAWRLEAKKIQ
ncbi:MAG: class I SAM-dependent methyltransferase [Gammaproteobacteria bacterium]|nr:class I SAM-dependent methyltransferase [Gammaproteobacteria bacterium]